MRPTLALRGASGSALEVKFWESEAATTGPAANEHIARWLDTVIDADRAITN